MELLEESGYYEWLQVLPLWAGLAIGSFVTAAVFLIGKRLLGRRPERRKHLRRWGNPLDLQVSGTDVDHAILVNRSEGGLGMTVKRPIMPGTAFKVRPVEAPGSVPWIGVVARHCHAAGREWFVGCRFEEEVAWDVLVWFG